MCSSPRLKFWHSSLSLNKDDDKNLKPIPIWKGTLCQIPLPSVDVLGRDVRGCADAVSSLLLFHSTRNGLSSMGAQDHSLQLTQKQCLLCHFASSAIPVWQGQVLWAAVGLQWPTHQTDWLCSELLHPCTVAICPSGVSCTPKSLEKHLSTFQSTSIPKHIFSLLSRYWQACHALLGQWLIATK